MSITPTNALTFKKISKAYSLYACSLAFIMQSPLVLVLCLVALLACGVAEHIGHG